MATIPIRLDPFQQIVNVQLIPKTFVLLSALGQFPVNPLDVPILQIWRIIDPRDGSVILDGTDSVSDRYIIATRVSYLKFDPASLPENASAARGMSDINGNRGYFSGEIDLAAQIRSYSAGPILNWIATIFLDTLRFDDPQIPIAAQRDGVVAAMNTQPPLEPLTISTPVYQKYDNTGGIVWNGDLTDHSAVRRFQDVEIKGISNVKKRV